MGKLKKVKLNALSSVKDGAQPLAVVAVRKERKRMDREKLASLLKEMSFKEPEALAEALCADELDEAGVVKALKDALPEPKVETVSRKAVATLGDGTVVYDTDSAQLQSLAKELEQGRLEKARAPYPLLLKFAPTALDAALKSAAKADELKALETKLSSVALPSEVGSTSGFEESADIPTFERYEDECRKWAEANGVSGADALAGFGETEKGRKMRAAMYGEGV